MKPTLLKNKFNNERFVCDDLRAVEVIDGIEYLMVHRPGESRSFKMRKEALEKTQEKLPQ